MGIPKISEMPNIDNLTPEQRALLVAQLKKAEIAGASTEKPVLAVSEKISNVPKAPVAEVVVKAEKLPEGSVPVQVSSPENHPVVLSVQQQLADMLNGKISGSEAEAAMAKLIDQN